MSSNEDLDDAPVYRALPLVSMLAGAMLSGWLVGVVRMNPLWLLVAFVILMGGLMRRIRRFEGFFGARLQQQIQQRMVKFDHNTAVIIRLRMAAVRRLNGSMGP